MACRTPGLSIVVPVRNASRLVAVCLAALGRAGAERHELIVVDDASTDDTAAVAGARGARVLRMADPVGPAAARNLGARAASGAVLLFVDADVAVHEDALDRVRLRFERDPGLAALVGSYDDAPVETNFLSQYKNLQHHFVHQASGARVTSFWSGLGAVRAAAFRAVGGFDPRRYRAPAIEDIELGYRMTAAGMRLELDHGLRGAHGKRWTWIGLLRTDFLHRALPWSRLIAETGHMPAELNLRWRDRASCALVATAAALLPAAVVDPRLLLATAVALGLATAANHDLYRFFWRKRGPWFALRAWPLHLLFHLYSAIAFLWGWTTGRIGVMLGSRRASSVPSMRSTAAGVAARFR